MGKTHSTVTVERGDIIGEQKIGPFKTPQTLQLLGLRSP